MGRSFIRSTFKLVRTRCDVGWFHLHVVLARGNYHKCYQTSFMPVYTDVYCILYV